MPDDEPGGRGDNADRVPAEGIGIEEAIASHTINVAYVNGFDAVTGSIRAGKSADLVVLDKDIFKLPTHEISKAKVLVTIFKGRPVFGDWEGVAR